MPGVSKCLTRAGALVLELLSRDVQISLDAAVDEKEQMLIRFIEGFWDKYQVTLMTLHEARARMDSLLNQMLTGMGYV